MRTRLVVARIRDLDPSAKVIHQDGSHQKWRLTTGASIVVPIHYRATYTFDGRGWVVPVCAPGDPGPGRGKSPPRPAASWRAGRDPPPWRCAKPACPRVTWARSWVSRALASPRSTMSRSAADLRSRDGGPVSAVGR